MVGSSSLGSMIRHKSFTITLPIIMQKVYRYLLFLLPTLLFFACEVEPIAVDVLDEQEEAIEAEIAKYDAELQLELAAVEKEIAGFPKRNTVTVPAGSVDALAAAIEQAGNGGTVLLESGLHTESETVVIPHRIKLVGQAGAVLEVNTSLHDFATTSLDPALHVLNARRTYITGIDIRPAGQAGGVAILVEDSPRTIILGNQIMDYQFGVILEASNYVYILRNELSGTPLWQTGEAPFATGILTMKGDNAVVSGNETSGFSIGIWACSRYGRVTGNESFGNFLGIILCTATPGGWKLPSGEFSGSDFSAFRTRMYFNNSHDNADVNIQAIDGANNNLVALNQAASAGRVDYEFTTETDRYGLPFTLPETFNNRAFIPVENSYVDCGTGNRIFGGDEIPATEASCF